MLFSNVDFHPQYISSEPHALLQSIDGAPHAPPQSIYDAPHAPPQFFDALSRIIDLFALPKPQHVAFPPLRQ